MNIRLKKVFTTLSRKKKLVLDDESKLARVLSLFDLSALGVGSTLGLGVYVLAGSVARKLAGPAVCISFLVAAIASAASGLCYAEFAARVPKAGSAYVYSYVTIGEFVAYIIGWNLLLEYGIASASVARGLSGYIDAITDGAIKNAMFSWAHMNVSFLAEYPDFFAFAVVVFFTIVLSIGVKESSRLNNVLTVLNITTILIVIISGIVKANPENWKIPKNDIPSNFTDEAGDGGFFPFGMSGMLAGAAQCFYGFVGFDCVATTSEEAINPKRNIPLAIVISLTVILSSYFGVSTILTMLWPYYDQDPTAPFPYIYDQLGWVAIKWIVTVGAVVALFTSLLGGLIPLPRVIYAMSTDGLIFKFFSKVHPKTKTPINATIVSGIIVAIMAVLFDTDQLINMMSIGTLLAYTIVAVCVLDLRYKPTENSNFTKLELTGLNVFIHIFNTKGSKDATTFSSKITNCSIIVFTVVAIAFDAFVIFAVSDLSKIEFLIPFIVFIIVMIVLVIIIGRQPTVDADLSFKVPLVPVIPCLSIIINLYLMLQLDVETWIRLAVWMTIGFLIYFFYGIKHSKERIVKCEKTPSLK